MHACIADLFCKLRTSSVANWSISERKIGCATHCSTRRPSRRSFRRFWLYNLLRDLPFDAIEFTSYETLKMFWKFFNGDHEPQQHETAAIGALAEMLTVAITTPLDVVKKRLMRKGGRVGLSGSDGLNPCSSQRYGGIVDCFM